jgi:cytochrome c oxidase assembly protein Cox11
MLKKIFAILSKTKNYARIVGVILFLVGLLGFAFRTGSSLPDLYLLICLVLGFWGIVASFMDNGSSGTPQ